MKSIVFIRVNTEVFVRARDRIIYTPISHTRGLYWRYNESRGFYFTTGNLDMFPKYPLELHEIVDNTYIKIVEVDLNEDQSRN